MASITKINGKRGISYRITVSGGSNGEGKRIRVSTTWHPDNEHSPAKQKKALEKYAADFEKKVKKGNCMGGKMTFRAFTEYWLREYAANRLEPSTISSYNNYLERHILPAIGQYALGEIKPTYLQSFYNTMINDKGYASASVRKCHAIISSIFSAAFKWQLIEGNPCDRVTPPRLSGSTCIKYFNLEQTERFLKFIDNSSSVTPQLRLFFYMAVFGGFRRGELIALTWDKIDFEHNTVGVESATGYGSKSVYNKQPKTRGSIRVLAMPDEVMEMLYIHKQNNGRGEYVFTGIDGGQMYLTTPSHAFRKTVEAYNESVSEDMHLPYIGLHGLRHTHATLLIYANTDIKTVSARLGHSQASTTLNIYAHSLKRADEVCAKTIGGLLMGEK